MIYALIGQGQQKANITQACRVLSVSRAGYYAAQKRSSAAVICVESVNLKAAFEESEQTSGSRRLITAMQTKGFKIGRYKVRRLMQEAGLKPVWKRKFVSTTDSNHALPVAANILNRQFNPEQPNQAWVSDITY
ncbi:IS3 family transposase, partial [Iodobacter sp. LRB]|uniref:IS3 family transposase n=1 Tax=Iodobacter sp. LRB TaxID=3127955 RepID=UPI00307FAF29